ncbi:MAG TPA: 3-hydroxybutyryl-CoA dehydrogenase, partial [Chryseobacterium sp.]|nr:3-hydroxybutyryl-CoA dehydrogenase [Chryseobacterium sp.]
MIKNIVVIGAGTMGNGIAHTFAQSGFKVNLVDVSQEALDRGLKTITTNLDRIIAKGNLTEEQKAETLGNITTFTALQDAVGSADLIVEAATENQELKLKIFGQMDEFAPENCILATNTSSISITKIAA